MSEKSCSVRLVTGTVILRNSKPHVLFLISPITSLHEHIATYEVGGGGGGGAGEGACGRRVYSVTTPPRSWI